MKITLQSNGSKIINFTDHGKLNSGVVFDTVWLKQPKNFSINVSVQCFENTGPDEPMKILLYGGITIFETKGKDGNGIFHETDQALENVPCSSVEQQGWRNSAVSFITTAETKYLVLVHFFYPKISSVRSVLHLWKSYCSGANIQVDSSSLRRTILDYFYFASGHRKHGDYFRSYIPNQNISTRECVVFRFATIVRKLTMFQKPQIRRTEIVFFYPFGHWVKEAELKFYKVQYSITSMADIVMFESINSSSLVVQSENFLKPKLKQMPCSILKEETVLQGTLPRFIMLKPNDPVSTFTKCTDVSFQRSFIGKDGIFYGKDRITLLFPMKDIERTWATVTIQLVTCQRLYDSSYVSFLPISLVKSVMNLHCLSFAPNSQTKSFNILQFLEKNGFSQIDLNMSFYLDAFGKKFTFTHGTMSLNPPVPLGPSDVYIFSNISQSSKNEYGFLELRYRMCFPQFRVSLPNNYISLYFPLSFLPQCYYIAKHGCSFDILISNSIFKQAAQIKIQTRLPIGRVPKYYNLNAMGVFVTHNLSAGVKQINIAKKKECNFQKYTA